MGIPAGMRARGLWGVQQGRLSSASLVRLEDRTRVETCRGLRGVADGFLIESCSLVPRKLECGADGGGLLFVSAATAPRMTALGVARLRGAISFSAVGGRIELGIYFAATTWFLARPPRCL